MTKIALLYPSDPFDSKKVDPDFEQECQAMRSQGLAVALAPADLGTTSSWAFSCLEQPSRLLYRGWMLSLPDYEKLQLLAAKAGHSLLVPLEEYHQNHYLPKWICAVAHLTPSTWVLPSTDINKLVTWFSISSNASTPVFVKDFVKSLKTKPGPVVNSVSAFRSLLEAMRQYRGLIEGGIAVREKLDLVPGSEYRVFVSKGEVFGSLPAEYVPVCQEAVTALGPRLFYTLDLAKDTSGRVWLIEVGDGQVSDFNADTATHGLAMAEFTHAVGQVVAAL